MEQPDCLHKIKIDISDCISFLNSLNGHIHTNSDIVKWFKQLCDYLTRIIKHISKLHKQIKEDMAVDTKDTLLLYLSQALSFLTLLINVFVQESEVEEILTAARSCAIKQILCCLRGIEETLTTKKEILDASGSFIKWMDSALDKIAEIEADSKKDDIIEICSDSKVLIEEVLSHAMSIAQVALAEDCKIIRGSSQVVLESLDSLTNEISKPNPNGAMITLFVDLCTDKLCALERRVNTAVLKLCLKVFSEYTLALQTIHDFCFNGEKSGKSEEMDGLVADFDLHIDRIMQIGLFAVSCCTSGGRAIKIRSCLASLEALECELVPAYTSVLLDRSVHNVNLALLLRNYWFQQAKVLQQLIFLIIDPSAFCQVVYEEHKQIVDHMVDALKENETDGLDKTNLKNLIVQSKVLQKFISVAVTEELEVNTGNIKNILDDFKNVLNEVKCASEILLDENHDSKNDLRVLKRCKILLTTTKKLWYSFLEDVENLNKKSKTSQDSQVSENISNGENIKTGNAFMDHVINRGKQILKDRSVLYRSSMKNETFSEQVSALRKMRQNKSSSLLKLIHLRKISFMNSMAKEENSAELQLADILNELNNMTNTFMKP